MSSNNANPSRTQVLQVVGNAIVGGMETCVLRLVERLPQDRFGVTVLCPYESTLADQLRALGAEVVITPMPENPPWCSIQLACSLIKAKSIDIIQAHMSNAHLLAALAGKLTGTPVIGTVHGRQLSTTDLELHRLAGTHISVVCQQTYFHALGLGVNQAQLHCIPNGVDVNIFKPLKCRDGAIRQRFSIAAEAPLIGFVGRLTHEKGPTDFLRAAMVVHHARPDVHFVLVGEGPMLVQLEDFVAQYHLSGVVHFAGLQTDMPLVYSELDALASTSYSEAMPLAVMEAMASGLPIVATSVGGVPDLVQHGVTGLMADGGDFELIGRHLLQILQHPDQMADMGSLGRQRTQERFSLDRSVDSTIQLLTLLSQTRPDHRRMATPSDAKILINGNGSKGSANTDLRHAASSF